MPHRLKISLLVITLFSLASAQRAFGQTSGSSQIQISHKVMVQPSLTLRCEETTHNISLTGAGIEFTELEGSFGYQRRF